MGPDQAQCQVLSVSDLGPITIPAMTEGPVLDCWTCLRINAQCFSGELCGGTHRDGGRAMWQPVG